MRGKSLGTRKRDRCGSDGRKARFVERQEAGPFHEIGDRKPARKTGAAAGREDVVGPGDIVADRLGRLTAKEDRARMAHAREQRVGLGRIDRELQMFGRQPVAERDRVGQVRHDDDRAIVGPARLHRRRGAQRRDDRGDRVGDRIGKSAIVGEQDRLARRVMFGLAQ